MRRVLEAVGHGKGTRLGAELLKRIMKRYGQPRKIVTDGLCSYSAAMKEIGAADRHEVGGRLTIGRRISPAVSTTRAGDAAVSKCEDAAEVQLSSRPGPQPFQSGAASRHPAGLQAETHSRIGGMARPYGVDNRLRVGISRNASTNRRYFDNALSRVPLDRWSPRERELTNKPSFAKTGCPH